MSHFFFILSIALFTQVLTAEAKEFSVYNVYNVASTLPMGNPGEVRLKDYYVNMGSHQGLKKGDHLEALRRVPSYDLIDQEFSRDLLFPIAVLRVIHVQSNAAICRLEKMLPVLDTPSISPQGVMVGDYIRILGRSELPQLSSKDDVRQEGSSQAQLKIQAEVNASAPLLGQRAESTSVPSVSLNGDQANQPRD